MHLFVTQDIKVYNILEDEKKYIQHFQTLQVIYFLQNIKEMSTAILCKRFTT